MKQTAKSRAMAHWRACKSALPSSVGAAAAGAVAVVGDASIPQQCQPKSPSNRRQNQRHLGRPSLVAKPLAAPQAWVKDGRCVRVVLAVVGDAAAVLVLVVEAQEQLAVVLGFLLPVRQASMGRPGYALAPMLSPLPL